jgi:hypothetical protein
MQKQFVRQAGDSIPARDFAQNMLQYQSLLLN